MQFLYKDLIKKCRHKLLRIDYQVYCLQFDKPKKTQFCLEGQCVNLNCVFHVFIWSIRLFAIGTQNRSTHFLRRKAVTSTFHFFPLWVSVTTFYVQKQSLLHSITFDYAFLYCLYLNWQKCRRSANKLNKNMWSSQNVHKKCWFCAF